MRWPQHRARKLCLSFSLVITSMEMLLFLYEHREHSLSQILSQGILPLLRMFVVNFASITALFIFTVNLPNLAGTLKNLGQRLLRRQSIEVPPGVQLRALAQFIFTSRIFQEVFEPICRDLYDETCAALASKNIWKFRWIRIRGVWSFWAAFFAQMPISSFKMIYRIWKASR